VTNIDRAVSFQRAMAPPLSKIGRRKARTRPVDVAGGYFLSAGGAVSGLGSDFSAVSGTAGCGTITITGDPSSGSRMTIDRPERVEADRQE
jgi:hypothetical protein